MGRSPCCDREGVRKGPWTPEEDVVLVSYVQEHGPGNWRAVPAESGLMRCSKSCRLRWTNYLRPGIRRGGFSDKEEQLIVHLQALLGNRWAAIASYLSNRTDNDVKNYWNTNLKKKLLRVQKQQPSSYKGKWELRLQTDIDLARRALREALSFDAAAARPCPPPPGTTTTTTSPAAPSHDPAPYALSVRNVSMTMLDGWWAPRAAGRSSSELTDCSAAGSTSSNWTGGPPFRRDAAVKQDQVPLSAIESWLLGDDGGEQQQQMVAAQESLLLDAALHSFAF